VPQWRIIRGQPPRELYGGEVLAIIDAPTGNAAIEEYARSSGRGFSRVNNDRIQLDGDAPFTVGFLNVARPWPNPGDDATGDTRGQTVDPRHPRARDILEGLVGKEIRTVTGVANRVLSIGASTVLVATNRSPEGAPVPVEWVENGLELLFQNGEVTVDTDVLEHRSAFVAAVLLTLPGTSVVGAAPPRIVLSRFENVNGEWDLEPGDSVRRGELHDRYGGSRQGGTIPSRSTPNIFLFLDKTVGAAHGYYDGWAGDRFYYTGHGQTGDQEFHRGNLAVLNHAADGKALRIFRGVRGEVLYLGEFSLEAARPWFRMEAPESGSDATRQVIVFRLIPVGDVIHDEQDNVEFPSGVAPEDVDAVVSGAVNEPLVREVPVERQHVEQVEVAQTTTSYTAARREQTLVLEYCAMLTAAGSDVTRFRIRPRGEARELVSDIYDKTRNNLIEAKGTGSRGEVRMAIGQLFDYRRFVDPTPACAVLLPLRPRDDIEELLRSADIAAVWKDGETFADNAHGAFV
jgi:hypothetical protein